MRSSHARRLPDPETVVTRLIAAFGGSKQFFQALDEQHRDFNAIWDQDAGRIGRVLRAHLSLEHFITLNLCAKNPRLGSVEAARLTCAQKIELLGSDPVMDLIRPGLRRINAIRNRVAHRLRVEVNDEDRDALLGIPIYAAMRAEGENRSGRLPDDVLSVVEHFAMFAASLLQPSRISEDVWRQAFREDENV